MKRIAFVSAVILAGITRASAAQQPATDGPYKVLMRERVGGEGGTDYIYADSADRPALHHAQRGARRPGHGQHARP